MKKRYLIGCPYGATVPQNTEKMIDAHVTEQDEVQLIRKLSGGQYVVEMTEQHARTFASTREDIIIEEDLPLDLYLPMPGLPPRVSPDSEFTLKIAVSDENTGAPISHVTTYCVGEKLSYSGLTGKDGIANVRLPTLDINYIIGSPRDTYWSNVKPVSALKNNMKIEISLKRIPITGTYDWGHLVIGIDRLNRTFMGKDIKVALIDSGITAHEDLVTAGGYNTLDGQDEKDWDIDEKGHGTHCAGIIAAQANEKGVTGIAPLADVFALKIFPGGRISDLLEAINWCVDNYMDVISLSLGSPYPATHLETALREANERGVICVAAAGNDKGRVSYPAAYETVLAVSAIGSLNAFPEDSAHALKISEYVGRDGQFFFADFSNYGPEIDVCAPGVAILSSVPTGYAAWDGTSMACPFVAGLAALLLEAYPEARTGDGRQPYYVRRIIKDTAKDIGLPAEMQGAGVVDAVAALTDASYQRRSVDETLGAYKRYMQALLFEYRNAAKNLESAISKLDQI